MIELKNGLYVKDSRLGRVPSTTTEHFDKYPLTASTMPSSSASMIFGINWYENFDVPVPTIIRGVKRYLIGNGSFGPVRGGHAVCGRNWKLTDVLDWHRFYNQGTEGRCVEFAKLRMMSQINRRRYDITSRWHYHTDQHIDEWPGCYLGHDGGTYEGTSCRAGLKSLKDFGAIPAKPNGVLVTEAEIDSTLSFQDGIAAYRWALNWDDVRTALKVPSYLPGVPINNSWGLGYPKEVILVDAAGERVLSEGGEMGIVTDK